MAGLILVAEKSLEFAETISAHLQNRGRKVLVIDQFWELYEEFSIHPGEISLVIFSEVFWDQEKVISQTILDALDVLAEEGLARDLSIIFRPSGISVPGSVERKTRFVWRRPYDLDELTKLVGESEASRFSRVSG